MNKYFNILSYIKFILIDVIVIFIRLYQLVVSPYLSPSCRYIPTCSEYSIQAFKKYGLIKGFYLTLRRIISCHPWGGSGYHPLT